MISFTGLLSTKPVVHKLHLPLLKFHAQFPEQLVHAFVTAYLESSLIFQSLTCVTMLGRLSEYASTPVLP